MKGAIPVKALGALRAGDRLLVSTGREPGSGAPYCRLLGGRVEAGETAAEALAREVEEELGLAIEVGGLAWVVENRFLFEGRPGHELLLVFPCRARARDWPGPDPVVPREADLALDWVRVDDLRRGAVPFVPPVLGAALAGEPPPAGLVRHLVQDVRDPRWEPRR